MAGFLAVVVPDGAVAPLPAPAAQPAIEAQVWSPPEIALPGIFWVETFVVLACAVIVSLLTIRGVRRHLLTNITPGPELQRVSYTGLFVAIFAALALGGVFVATGTPLWKYVIAPLAALIAARVLLHFLQDFRRARWRR